MKPTKLAHTLWKEHLLSLKKENPILVDATCGNGHDSLVLASFSQNLHCIDIQQTAIENTQNRLETKGFFSTTFHHRSHDDFSFLPQKADLFAYNLGYLPGGDKKLITTPENTLKSLKSALLHLSKEGLITLLIYTGHPGGKEEKGAILAFLSSLPPSYEVSQTSYPNKSLCPELITISRNNTQHT